MQEVAEKTSAPVGAYRFGHLEIDGQAYDHDLIYYRGEVVSWWRKKGHKVKVADIQLLLGQRPEVVVFGTGHMGIMRIGKKAVAALKLAQVGIIAKRTPKAIEHFNALLAEGRDAALAIHLTC